MRTKPVKSYSSNKKKTKFLNPQQLLPEVTTPLRFDCKHNLITRPISSSKSTRKLIDLNFRNSYFDVIYLQTSCVKLIENFEFLKYLQPLSIKMNIHFPCLLLVFSTFNNNLV